MSKVEIRKPEKGELDTLGVNKWPVWTCGVSEFPWHYDDKETCYILEGNVEIVTPDGVFTIEPGDFVIFDVGLSCRWRVKSPVKKHYHFG